MNDDREVHPHVAGYTELVRADERARCIKVLEALQRQRGNDACPTWAEAIAALSSPGPTKEDQHEQRRDGLRRRAEDA